MGYESQTTLKWDRRFMEAARLFASWSCDPSTRVGAIVVDDRKRLRCTGFNGFPCGIADTPERLENRELKYELVVHAEENALLQAAASGVSVLGCKLYTTMPPCVRCAVSIVQAGIVEVVYPADIVLPERWQENCVRALAVFEEAGVLVRVSQV